MFRNSVNGVLVAALAAAILNCAQNSFAGFGSGTSISVPEISPSAAASAIAVLAGSGLMLAERFQFRRKS